MHSKMPRRGWSKSWGASHPDCLKQLTWSQRHDHQLLRRYGRRQRHRVHSALMTFGIPELFVLGCLCLIVLILATIVVMAILRPQQ